jgi:hypothetical protein
MGASKERAAHRRSAKSSGGMSLLLWHKADVPRSMRNICFWNKSGHVRLQRVGDSIEKRRFISNDEPTDHLLCQSSTKIVGQVNISVADTRSLMG